MAYYVRDYITDAPVLSARRPTINEFFLSSYTLNVYTGCEIGCPYCDSWAYSDRPLNETIQVPIDLPQRLAAELEHIDTGDLIGITALSDPYQPAEQHYRLTRQVLQLFAERGQPTLVLTKSPMILEDLPLLQRIQQQSMVVVMTTLVSTDINLAAKLEGKAPPPPLRLEMLAELKRAGIPVGVALLPIMPYVNDTDYVLRSMLRACADIGVDFVVWDYLHIPSERYRSRINDLLTRIGSYPVTYYRDIYRGKALVDPLYRQDRDRELLARCDSLGLMARAPQHLYAGKLSQANTLALMLKHTAFRDRVQGRDRVARIHRELADRVYAGEIHDAELRRSPIYPSLAEQLAHTSYSEQRNVDA